MTTAPDLVREIQSVGGELIPLDNGRLRVEAPEPLPEHLIARLRQDKAEVINFLAYRNRLLSGWDAEMARLIEWFLTIEPPSQPFEISRGVTHLHPEKSFASLRQDIAAGPNGPRAYTGALQADLGKLWSYFNEEGVQTRGTA